MKTDKVIKLNLTGIFLLASICFSMLTACGGGGSDGGGSAPNDPSPGAFPTQVAKPSSSVVNDNGSLILAQTGLSLYTFDNDSMNTSTCEGSPDDTDTCAGRWPPLLASDGAVANSEMTIITRSDSAKQWAFKGRPLYHWFQDSVQGDINGDGIDGVWHLARPMPLMTMTINDIASYTGKETILSVSSSADVLTQMRIDKDGYTLYIFDDDPINDSACAGDCINIWPPLLADTGAMAMAPLSIITASNGNKQWAYKSKPLYFFVSDSAAGDTNGDEVDNTWHTATQEPAILRTTVNGRSISATGQVNVLMSVNGSNSEFEVMSMDKDGFSLYVFDNDAMNMSSCTEDCLVNWPAFVPSDEDTDIANFTIFTRADGTKQWAHNDMALYFFKNDLARADINGDGVNGVWHLILPTITTPIITTMFKEENALGATVTVDSSVHVMVRDPNTMLFVDEIIDKSDFSLYTFDNDSAGVSNCADTCLDAWPALLASDTDIASAPFSIITRADGMKQWTINDMPLYFFSSDFSAADSNGENVNNIWHLARPAPVKVDGNAKGDLLAAHGDVLDSQGKTAAQLTGLTLYTFDTDVMGSGVSQCFDGCAVTWPPLYATAMAQAFGDFSIISRSENSTTTFQWVYKGLPLYFYVGDSQIGDTTGDYPSWTIARP